MDDTIELFHRNDIRGLNRNRYYAKYKHYFTFIIAIATVVCILSFVTLLVVYKTVFSHDSQLIKNDVNDHYNNDHYNNELMYDHIDDNLIAKKGSVQINHMTPPEIPYEVTTETAQSNGKCDISPNDRFDCNPDTPITSDVCASRGCCWQKTNSSRNDPPLNVPYCFYPLNYNGYKIINKEQQYHRIIVTLERQIDSGFPNDLRYVKLDITSLNDFTIRIKFYDPQKRRFEVPIPKLNINEWPVLKEPLFNVSITNDSQLIVTRKMFGTKVFRVNLNQLVFADQFLQLSSNLPSKYIYGLGEHKDAFRKEVTWKRYTMFNRDQPPVENINLYGSHPFYMSVEDGNGTSHGVLLFNSNAMDVILSPKPAITWRTIGGVFDFFVFLGPKPDDVVRQYTNLIGLPLLPPFWGLGFHLCRFGYKNLSNMNATFERNRRAEIPYDVQWNDIDAMHNHNDFSYDDLNFSGLPKFIENLHSYGMKYVPMFDCGISAGETPGKYPPYDDGVTMDIFVKNSTGQIFKGKVWNKVSTAFPDFTHPKAAEYWTRQFSRYHKVIPFDGSWIDMNEPSNFLDGSFNGCPVNPIENPHYIPGGGTIQSLRQKTLCMTAEHFMGQHYNIHNLYGISETIATNIALKAVLQKRPFIISRSTFVGHGHFGSHWDGDVFSTWDDMQWTIPSILNFNLFGIPLIGADICGFNGNTTVELCARWSQLGAFYPFSRNHNSDDTIDQDPAALGDVVIKSAKDALMIRYSILSYLYTLFYNAHVNGDTVVRPLFFEFPNDKISYEIETQFLWGAAFMIIPTLMENATQVHAYLPKSQWYDFVNYTLIKSKGEYKMFDSPITKINVLLRGGYIVPYQDPKVITDETRKGNFTLIVALDENKSADGELYWDDGESLDNILLGNYNFIKFHVKAGSLMSKPSFFGYTLTPLLESVKILGMDTSPKSVKINGVDVSTFTYDQNNKYLKIYKIELSLEQQIYINWN